MKERWRSRTTTAKGASREQAQDDGSPSRVQSWARKARRHSPFSAGQHLNHDIAPITKPLASRIFHRNFDAASAHGKHFCSWWAAAAPGEPEPLLADIRFSTNCARLSAAECPVIPSGRQNLAQYEAAPLRDLFDNATAQDGV